MVAALRAKFPDVEIETVVLRTRGDKILDKPLVDFGGRAFLSQSLKKQSGIGKLILRSTVRKICRWNLEKVW